MKCPKCDNTITRLVMTRKSFQYVYILKNGEIEVSPPDVRSLIALTCQYCGEDISGMTSEIEDIIEKAMYRSTQHE